MERGQSGKETFSVWILAGKGSIRYKEIRFCVIQFQTSTEHLVFQGTVLTGKSRRRRQSLNSELRIQGRGSKLVLSSQKHKEEHRKNTGKLITVLLRDVV